MVEEAQSSQPLSGPQSPLQIVFREACERLIHTRALLDDPRHLTKRQASAVTSLLGDGIAAVDRQLASLRIAVYEADSRQTARVASGIGMAVAGLRQIHAHLGLLGTRWPLGTADLFVRKLVAEGTPLAIPTLCPTDEAGDTAGEVGESLRERLSACGLTITPVESARPVLRIQTADIVEPLAWPCLIYPLAGWTVARRDLASQLHSPQEPDGDGYLRLCTAVAAARVLGEPIFAALAVKALLGAWSGAGRNRDLPLLAIATKPYAMATDFQGAKSLLDYFGSAIASQRGIGSGWGMPAAAEEVQIDDQIWAGVREHLAALLPEPTLAPAEEIDALVECLSDGRPINARPKALPDDFTERLDACVDAEQFYAAIGVVGEQP